MPDPIAEIPKTTPDASSRKQMKESLWTRMIRFIGQYLILITISIILLTAFVLALIPSARDVALPELIWLPAISIITLGLRWWQSEVNERRPRGDRVPAHAVLLALVFWILLTVPLYVLSRALWTHSNGVSGFFVATVWGLSAAAAGGLIGFLFGTSKPANGDSATKDATGKAAPPTNLEQISQFLTTVITGGTVFQAHKLGEYVTGLGSYFAGIVTGTASAAFSDSLKVLGSASAVYFAITGFLALYLMTKLFLAIAIEQAESGGAETGEKNARLSSLMQSSLGTDDLSLSSLSAQQAEVGHEAYELATSLAKVCPDTLDDWRDLRLNGKAQLIVDNTKAALAAFRKAKEIVGHDAEIHLCLAIALQKSESKEDHGNLGEVSDSVQRTILSEIEAARKSLNAFSDPSLRKNVYKSLTHAYLYLRPPDSFLKCIQAGKEYMAMPDSPESAGCYLNVACGYGQAVHWVDLGKDNVDGPALAAKLGIIPTPADVTALRAELVEKSLFYLKKTLARKSSLLARVRALAGLPPLAGFEATPTLPDRDLDVEGLRQEVDALTTALAKLLPKPTGTTAGTAGSAVSTSSPETVVAAPPAPSTPPSPPTPPSETTEEKT